MTAFDKCCPYWFGQWQAGRILLVVQLQIIKQHTMHLSLNFFKAFGKIIFLPAFIVPAFGMQGHCSNDNDSSGKNTTHPSTNEQRKLQQVKEYLQGFYPIEKRFEYSITVCADLPVNDKPGCVYKKGETGHVFLILSKSDSITGNITTRSFGFYPRLAVTCLFKQSRSRILENNGREYNASIEKKLTAKEFESIVEKCMELGKKKYNLKKFNCYDYVIEVFNSLPGIEKLPVTKVKFPFIFGRGGSPCGLYSDLKKLASNGWARTSVIRFGIFKSPGSDASQNLAASH